jgi:hypothetical protein
MSETEPVTGPELLSAADIEAANDIGFEDVAVPEWGGTVRVRGMNGFQRALINGTMVAIRGQSVELKAEALAQVELKVVTMSLVDANLKPLFTLKQMQKLGAKRAGVVSQLYATAERLSGTGKGAVEDAAKNSGSTPSSASTTA